MENHALSHLKVEPNLALEFLGTFSRLEYALKVTKFLLQNGSEAKADWVKFSKEIKDKTINHSAKEFQYLLSYDLKRLESSSGSPEWKLFDTSKTTNDIDTVLLKIKQIRNNLFHGGKYAPSDNSNDNLLLGHSIKVLLEIKSLLPEVNTAYDY